MKQKQHEEVRELTYQNVLIEADKVDNTYNKARESVASKLLALSSQCADIEIFKDNCTAAEMERKRDLSAKIVNSEDLRTMTKKQKQAFLRAPAAWTNAKSRIKALWEDHLIHPKTCRTFGEVLAKIEAAKDAKRKQDAERARQESPTPEGSNIITSPMAAQQAVGQAVLSIKDSLHPLILRIRSLQPGNQAELLEEIDQLVTSYEKYEAETGTDDQATDDGEQPRKATVTK